LITPSDASAQPSRRPEDESQGPEMVATQRIARVRRQYNQWVANQTLEDYALRFTATEARRWSPERVANTALGAISFLALEAIGGVITLHYGFVNAVTAILVVSAIIFATSMAVGFYAARYGVDIDLLTRGAGFGYIGSTLSSLIYAIFTFIFFAIEAAIMAQALLICFGVPLVFGYVVSALLIIPLVTHGITFISRLQLWSQPVWALLQVLPFAFIAVEHPQLFSAWRHFPGEVSGAATFDLAWFGAAASVVFSLTAQIGEQVDFLRFLPHRRSRGDVRWWLALTAAGPGWILIGGAKMLAGSLLAVLAVSASTDVAQAAEPTRMYRVAFGYVFDSPGVVLTVTGLFIFLSQIKINVTNAYAGSIAWSNFFSRLTHSHPGRVVWLVFNVLIALLLMQLGVYRTFDRILALYSNLAVAWVGAMVADLVISKWLGLSPPGIEFKRAHLPDINPAGVGAMFMATTLALIAFSGVFGAVVQGMAGFIGLGAAFITAPLIAYLTGGRYYIARNSPPFAPAGSAARGDGRIVCNICEIPFEVPDMAMCPAYGGPICSLCCTLDARCGDRCKPGAGAVQLLTAGLKPLLPRWLFARLHSRLVHYAGVLSILCLLIAVMLALVYLQASIDFAAEILAVRAIFWEIFCILVIMAGVAAWLLVLAQESRSVAQEETQRQTALLMTEIAAHRRTDAELQRAKEVAEAANLAKTRYMVGISHELRSPLNAVFGYAQLLDRDPTIPARRRNAIKVIRRSAEHMSGLIEGLLEISKIQAGRLDLQRNEVRLAEFLEQIVDMFRLQAAEKGLDFRFHCGPTLPKVVHTDEKRLRQIVINLLSNALKFTRAGQVSLAVKRLGEVSVIEVTDSGIGIHPDELQQIFEPFVQGTMSGGEGINGTGLGLTICKMLTEAMGGEISVRSTLGQGSQFRVRLLLPKVLQPAHVSAGDTPVAGYEGKRLTILLADDDEDHRDLVNDLLQPLGFTFHAVADGLACLGAVATHDPDIVLLDISMPGMTGWDVARRLRETDSHRPRIVMLSGNAAELDAYRNVPKSHDATLTKPMSVQVLLGIIAQLSPLTWVPAAQEADAKELAAPAMVPAEFAQTTLPMRGQLQDLYRLGDIGYVRGIREKLAEIAKQAPHTAPFIETLEAIVGRLDLPRYMDILNRLLHGERR
jgi:signal transduction histidine kinase/CheY-like chemotaxis protein/purine-cytosine permease-like protein